jgi:hypothetical protein
MKRLSSVLAPGKVAGPRYNEQMARLVDR